MRRWLNLLPSPVKAKSKWQSFLWCISHTHIHTHTCVCIYVCVHIHVCLCQLCHLAVACICSFLINIQVQGTPVSPTPTPPASVLSWLRTSSTFQIAHLATFLSGFLSRSLYHRNKTSYFPFLVIKLYDNIWECCFKIQLSPYSKPWGAADRRASLERASLAKWLGFEMVPDDCYQMLNIWK